MSRISDRIKKYISCPQFGNDNYGEWGILTLEQRRLIKELVETCDMFEETADAFAKENKELKHLLSNCIEPKFKIGQEIWETRPFMAWEVTSIKFKKYDGILYQMYHLGHKGTDDYNSCVLPSDSDRFFATEEEAKARLEEMKK